MCNYISSDRNSLQMVYPVPYSIHMDAEIWHVSILDPNYHVQSTKTAILWQNTFHQHGVYRFLLFMLVIHVINLYQHLQILIIHFPLKQFPLSVGEHSLLTCCSSFVLLQNIPTFSKKGTLQCSFKNRAVRVTFTEVFAPLTKNVPNNLLSLSIKLCEIQIF